MKRLLPLLILLSGIAALKAQSPSFSYDKEKIYIQTNHVFFSPGETVFFKLYLVRGASNKPSRISSTAHVDVYGPAGTVVEKQTYRVEDGYCEGSFTLDPDAAGGIYKLKGYTGWMLNEKDSLFFTKEFTVQKIIAPRVLMKLEFPKKGYGAGDEVSADFSMRSLDDKPIANHNGQFTVALAGDVQATHPFTTNTNGKARLSFTLPATLKTTDGLLNVTVSYDSYTESIARSIPITLNKIDLQFMPEGGTFVEGLATNLAFKAINEYGNPSDVKGIIKDDEGNMIDSFSSYKFGMGQLTFTPLPGKRYSATITSPAGIKEQYVLPKAAPQGIVMNVSKKNGLIHVKLIASNAAAIHLTGQAKSVPYYSKTLSLKKGVNEFPIDEKIFPMGITRLTLYDENKTPLAERIVFLNPDRQLHITITPDKQTYLPREKVSMTITTTDEKGTAIPSNLSLSVVDDKLWTLADDKQDHILSWLLMSSELQGRIEEPQFYFKKEEPKALAALDLVMLTNGYRYFDFIDEVTQARQLKYTPEETNIVSGMVTNEKGQPIPSTILLIHNIYNGKVIKQQLKDGQFFFPDLQGRDSYMLLAQSLHKKDKISIKVINNGIGYNPLKDDAIKKLTPDDPFAPPLKAPLPQPVPHPQQPNEQHLPPVGLKTKAEFPALNINKNQALNEVVVIGYGVQRRKGIAGSVTIVTGNDLAAVPVNDMPVALEGRAAGLEINHFANNEQENRIAIRGAGILHNGNDPLLVIDGIPQEKYNLSGINVNDISSISVLKDAASVSIYGSRAANGVILITTKTALYGKIHIDLTRNSHYASENFIVNTPSYTVARRFYAPKYTSIAPETRNDYRETIYWNPVVQTNRDGKATLEFYNSDATTTFRAIAEGIGFNGQPGRIETTYAAKAALSVDVKIPPYLTVGDKALIPVVIKNNASQPLDGVLTLSLPPNIQSSTPATTFNLGPDATQQLLVPLSATNPTTGQIEFKVTGNLGNESVTLPITAAAKGFPIRKTISGNTSTNQNLVINKTIPGSLHATLHVYKDVEGQLLNGIESMLQEPYGCFEQTSSTTYPNIFILKYLRQTGKSNPEIEKKAMSYIEHGYKKLIGFETSENGFEWFGKAPAHEALTAYGLLEFTAMQEFLDVDKKMLQRTKDFLLNRRNGHGGFTLKSGGYDRFASVPDKIANIYIVYALTQAGYGQEIQPEYAAAVKKALDSKDAYQLAMMALAASNIKNDQDYRLLMDALETNYRDHNGYAETSVVNSRDASLHVESTSLYALALMRNKTPDIGKIASLITNILAQKSYYGYGSTQATVLALQAVTEYSLLIGSEVNTDEMTFTLNGKTILPKDDPTTDLKEGTNTFTVEYPGARQGIPYNLEVAYNTLTPPNDEKAELLLTTTLNNARPKIGETVRLEIKAENAKDNLQPMAIAKIGIPAGLSIQPWQLKELIDKKKIAYYEIFDNYLVLYWMGFAPKETKTVELDLKADIPGSYKGKASNIYLYYTPEYKNWQEGLEAEIR